MRKIDLDAFFQLAEDVAPFLLPGFGLVGPQHFSEIPSFHAAQGLLHPPGFGVDPICCRGEPQRIVTHAGGLAKDRAPFHLAALFQVFQDHGIDTRRRVHQRITRHGRLAKDRASHLIRRDEPSTGTLPSNAILRFEKTSYTYHFFTVQRCLVHVAWLFYRYFERTV